MAALLAAWPALGAEGPLIAVPSGTRVWWQETVQNAPGPAGLTYRYRFVMPDLPKLVPSTEGPATGDLTAEDAAELDGLKGDGPVMGPEGGLMDVAPADIDLEAGTGGTDAALVDLDQLDLKDVPVPDDAAENPEPLPADPDVLKMDPVQEDMAWLCENWVLPRLAEPAPLPAQVVISVADRETVFGTPNPDAVQLFEAFTPSADRKTCTWAPW